MEKKTKPIYRENNIEEKTRKFGKKSVDMCNSFRRSRILLYLMWSTEYCNLQFYMYICHVLFEHIHHEGGEGVL